MAGKGDEGSTRRQPSWEEIMRRYAKGKLRWRIAAIPIVGRLFVPLDFRHEVEANWMVPVNEPIPRGESMGLPYDIVEPMLRKASAIFRVNHCPCRDGHHCQSYPHEIGCLIMGPAAGEIRPDFGAMISIEDAMSHVRAAVAIGLVPLIVHSVSDSWLFGIDYKRMLALCLCCDCCCDIRVGLKTGPMAFWGNVHRLPSASNLVPPRGRERDGSEPAGHTRGTHGD